MPIKDGDKSMSHLHRHRPIGVPPAAPPPPTKPHGGVRLLSYLLQALVMAVALAIFFLFAGVAAVVLLHLCIAGRAFPRHRHSVHTLTRRPHTSAAPAVLSPKDLRGLPCFDFPGAGRPDAECAVCLEGFREGDRCRALPGCKHAFHMLCVDRWLVRSPACPICRGGVTASASAPQPVEWF